MPGDVLNLLTLSNSFELTLLPIICLLPGSNGLSRIFVNFPLQPVYSLKTIHASRNNRRRDRRMDASGDNPRVGDLQASRRALGTFQDHAMETAERRGDQGGPDRARRSHQSPFPGRVPGPGLRRFIGRLGGLWNVK